MADNNGTTTKGFKAGIEIGPDGESTGNFICYPSDNPNCKVVREPKTASIESTGFLSLTEPMPFHDETLVEATAKINEILAKVLAKNEKKELHVIFSEDGPMLAWVRSMVRPVDDYVRHKELVEG